MVRYDIKQDDDGGLIVKNNDLVYAESDEQHIQDTINAAPGWWKENHADGVNISTYLKSAGQEQLISRKIKIELQSDRYIVGVPIIKFGANGKLSIQPNASI